MNPRTPPKADELSELMNSLDVTAPSKTLSALLAEGHAHAGGLAQLAAAEENGTLFGFSDEPAATSSPAGDDSEDDELVRWMRSHNIPVTREKYLALAYPDNLPEEWTAELEAQLPRSLQQPFDPEPSLRRRAKR